jgi:hypothetical protein
MVLGMPYLLPGLPRRRKMGMSATGAAYNGAEFCRRKGQGMGTTYYSQHSGILLTSGFASQEPGHDRGERHNYQRRRL